MSRTVWVVLRMVCLLLLLLLQGSRAAGPSYRSKSSHHQDIKQMAVALQLTSRLNARLNCEEGESPSNMVSHTPSSADRQEQSGVQQGQQLRGGGGGGGGAMVAPIRRPSAFVSDASTPTRNIELEKYLGKLFEILHFTELESTLAMIYLDRACSVETVRNGERCPFCAPSTVHKLVLTALLIAVSAVRKTNVKDYYKPLSDLLDISNCQPMVDCMTQSLGEDGIFVTPETIDDFRGVWKARFGKKD